jgi:hypothetical protein
MLELALVRDYYFFMVELLAIFGFLGWLFFELWEWLRSFPVFPAILFGLALVPTLGTLDYHLLSRQYGLAGISSGREPIPPERFYWTIQRPQMLRMILVQFVLAAAAWTNASILPASLDITRLSLIGWLNALAGVLAAARLISATALFFRASQWFDAMSPSVIGLFRQAMYRLSDNYEYLGQRQRRSEKEEVY